MAVCSFLGHQIYVYDRDILLRLVDATEKVVQENDKVDFLLSLKPAYSLSGVFLRTSLEMKIHYPSKVTITVLLDDQEEYETYKLQTHIPHCMVDRVVIVPDSVSQTRRWMIQQSTHLISYLYERFCEVENWELFYAKKQRGLQVIDITSEKTAQMIEEAIHTLSERERLIFQKLEEGCSLKEIGRLLGLVGSERVRQIRVDAAKKIRSSIFSSAFPVFSRKRGKPPVCSIFALGEGNSDIPYQTGLSFEYTIEYLHDKFGITHFKITEEYSNSTFMYILQRFKKRIHKDIQITLVMAGGLDSEPSDTLSFNCVENIDTTFSRGGPELEVIQSLMKQSDFCICNLAVSALANDIRKYAAQIAGLILLDIGEQRALTQF